MKILVTGASGLLGGNFLVSASRRGHEGLSLFRSHRIDSRRLGFEPVSLDLTRADETEALIGRASPEWIAHLAAWTDVDGCQKDPERALERNARVTSVVARAAAASGAKLLYLSTDSVADVERGCFREGAVPCPVNAYAESKLRGEREALAVLPGSLIARAAFYGWSVRPGRGLAEWITSSLSRGEKVVGFTDVFFTPILADDLCEILLHLMESDARGLFHVGSPDQISKYDFIRTVAEVFGWDGDLVRPASVTDSRLTAPRPRRPVLCVDKLTAQLGRRPPTVRQGVEKLRQLEASGHRQQLRELVAT